MPSTVKKLTEQRKINPPAWLPDNIQYECLMGSLAYGVATESSDKDIYGFCIPPKTLIFPHLAGDIPGFGKQTNRFEQFQQQSEDKSYDITIYSIVKYFELCMGNNPNMVDSMYVPQDCVIFCSQIAQRVRDKRDLFLSKKAFHTFKGYAYAQLAKIRNKDKVGKRAAGIEKYGYDLKFAYHLVRLLHECEQILEEGTLDLRRHREVLKDIRAGQWEEDEVRKYFDQKERHLEDLYHKSTLRYAPDEQEIKNLLLECLEIHYGSLDKAVSRGYNLEKELLDLEQKISEIRRMVGSNVSNI